MADSNVVKTLGIARGYLMNVIKDMSDEQLTVIPEGANNNVLWNLGHLAVSHAGLVYGPCGMEVPIPDGYGELFKGGSSPAGWSEAPNLNEVRDCFNAQHAKMMEEYQAGTFDAFSKMDLMPGVSLDNVEQSLGFCAVHEGVHIGTIISIKNLIG